MNDRIASNSSHNASVFTRLGPATCVALLLTLPFVFLPACSKQVQPDPAVAGTVEVYPFRYLSEDKWGLLLSDGRVVTPPVYDDMALGGFREGLVFVMKGDKAGFIDPYGQEVIPPQFVGEMNRYGTAFSEGFARVQVGEVHGFVDRSGAFVIPPTYDLAYGFSEGLAMVAWGEKKERRCGFIDHSGEVVIPFQFDDAQSFREGLASVRVAGEREYGYIDKTGAFVIPPQFGYAGSFKDGIAVVEDTVTGRKGLIDTNGDFLVPTKYDDVYYKFTDDLLGVIHHDLYGFIDRTGNEVIPCRYRFVEFFQGGLSPVWTLGPNGKWGVIDRSGRMIIDPKFDFLREFGCGLAPFNVGGEMHPSGNRIVGGEWGYVDREGNAVIAATYDDAFSFTDNGLARVRAEGRGRFITPTGQFVDYWFELNYDDSAVLPADMFDYLPEDRPRLHPSPEELLSRGRQDP